MAAKPSWMTDPDTGEHIPTYEPEEADDDWPCRPWSYGDPGPAIDGGV